MSDVQTETPTPAPEPPPAPAPADAGPTLEERVSALEGRVTTLESTHVTTTSSTAANTQDVFTRISSGSSFDAQARADELVQQGLSETDAVEQASYEERLWNERHGTTSA